MTCTISAVAVVFGGGTEQQECLRSLEVALARVPESELVVVLNAPLPTVRDGLERQGSNVVVVEPPENLGYAGGVTAALTRARGEWIALVNDDCDVDPQALVELLAVGCLSDDVGSVAAQVRFGSRPDTINSAGLEVDELGVAFERLLGEPISASERQPIDVFGATGTLGLFRRSMLDDTGGFDSSFFAYLEDADLAWRARMRGWRCLYAPLAVGLHRHSATYRHASPAKHFLVGRNRVRMIARNATGQHLRRRAVAMVAYDFGYVVFVGIRSGTLAPLRGRLRGLSEWRRYRAAGRLRRQATTFARAQGIRRALARNRVYRVSSHDVYGGS